MQYIETHKYQYNKLDNAVCGDSIFIERGKDSTIVIVIDGVGSGIKANICANLFGAQLLTFLAKGHSLLEACRMVLVSIKVGRKIDNFAAFTVANVLHNGYVQIVTYEGPQAVYINDKYAYVPQSHVHRAGSEILIESNVMLGPGKAVLLFSDGVSQSGMGHGYGYGIGSKGVAEKLNEYLTHNPRYEAACEKLLEYCKTISEFKWEDDTSLVLIKTRNAITANILTGPPAKKEMDEKFINDFNKTVGFKIIAGSTTLDVYSRHTGASVDLLPGSSPFEAPSYEVSDINFASEGAVMLNHLYNLYELNPANLDPEAAITKLKELIDLSDKIIFFLGTADNTEQNESMIFSQLRIFPRAKIVKMLAAKLKQLGKVVSINRY